MKRILLYIVVIGLSFAFPLNRTDVAKLQPVEAVGMYKAENQICLVTDTGDFGAGESVNDAVEDLKRNTAAVVYLDTAKYLLVSNDAKDEIKTIRNIMKPSVRLCIWDGEEDLEVACRYLSVHGDLSKLSQWNEGMKLPAYYCKKTSKN